MSNPNTTETSVTATDHGSTAPQRMSELLPLVARQLRSLGVVKVCARYEGEAVAFIFMGTDEHPLQQLTAVATACEIRQTLRSILARRYPDATKTEETSGYFEWDLAADTLRHEHVVTHHGI